MRPKDSEVRVFLCYRRRDGDWCAEWMHELLNGFEYLDADRTERQIVTYFDKTAPSVSNWKELHFPSLKAAHVLLAICTPGMAKDFSVRGEPDWVYEELRWWLRNRGTPPIVIDTTGEGGRWLPDLIAKKWPDINRIEVSRTDVAEATGELTPFSIRVRERIVGSIREAERATVFEDLERFRRLNRRLAFALSTVIIFFVAAALSAGFALKFNREAQNERNAALARQSLAQAQLERSRARGVSRTSALLSIESLRRGATLDAVNLLRQNLSRIPRPKAKPVSVIPLESPVVDFQFVANSDSIATATSDGHIRLWDMPTGEPLSTSINVGKTPLAIALNPRYELLAVSTEAGTVQFWDLAEQEMLGETDPVATRVALEFSMTGEHIASGSADGTLSLSYLDPNARSYHSAHEGLSVISFTHDSRSLVTIGPITPVSGPTRKLRRSTPGPITDDGEMEFDLDSAELRSYSTRDAPGQFRLWSAPHLRQELGSWYAGNLTSYSVSPDKKFLAASIASESEDAGILYLFSLESPFEQKGTFGYEGSVDKLAISTGGRYLIVGGATLSAQVWDGAEGTKIAEIEHGLSVSRIEFSENERYFVTATDDGIQIWDLGIDVEVMTRNLGSEVNSAKFSPDGKRFATGSSRGEVQIWRVDDGQEDFRYELNGAVAEIIYSSDGEYVAAGSSQGVVHVWRLESGEEVAQLKHGDFIRAMAASPDGRYLATSGADNKLIVWDRWNRSNPEAVFESRLSGGIGAASLAFSSDGSYLAVASDTSPILNSATGQRGSLEVWDLSGLPTPSRVSLSTSGVNAVKFSPDGRYLFVMERRFEALEDWVSGKPVEAMRYARIGHAWHIAVSSNGKYVATSRGGTASIWDVNSGAEVSRMAHQEQIRSIEFSPDSRFLLTAGAGGDVRVWYVEMADLIQEVCARLGQSLPLEEWKSYFGDEPFNPTCDSSDH